VLLLANETAPSPTYVVTQEERRRVGRTLLSIFRNREVTETQEGNCDCYAAYVARKMRCSESAVERLAPKSSCKCAGAGANDTAFASRSLTTKGRREELFLGLTLYQHHCHVTCSQGAGVRPHNAGLFSQLHIKWHEIVFKELRFRPVSTQGYSILNAAWGYLPQKCAHGALECYFERRRHACATKEEALENVQSWAKVNKERRSAKSQDTQVSGREIEEAKNEMKLANGYFARFLMWKRGLSFTDMVGVTTRYIFQPNAALRKRIFGEMERLGLVPGEFLGVNLRRGKDKLSEGITIQPYEEVAVAIQEHCRQHNVSTVHFMSDDEEILAFLRARLRGIRFTHIPRQRKEHGKNWDETGYLVMNCFIISLGAHFVGSLTSNLARFILELQLGWSAFGLETPSFTDLDEYLDMKRLREGWYFCAGNHCGLCRWNETVNRVCHVLTPCPWCKTGGYCTPVGCEDEGIQLTSVDTGAIMKI